MCLREFVLDKRNTNVGRFLLGRVYEYQENYESARSEYKLALPANLPDAYNNLGRLYIEDGKPFLAETYIVKGLGLAKKANDLTKTYTLLKNLGWAQMEQKRYNEAQKNLKKAIAINKMIITQVAIVIN